MGFLNKIFLFLNYVAALALLISNLAVYLKPDPFWLVSILGLGYPVLLLVNVLFSLFWMIRFKLHFLISLLAILVGWKDLTRTVNFNLPVMKKYFYQDSGDSIPVGGGRRIKFLSYNIRLFDLYNWQNSENRKTRNRIFDMLYRENPDILCLQEFYNDDDGTFKTLDTLKVFLDAKNFHVEYTKTLQEKYHWGIATFSKFPILRKGRIDFGKGNNICIYTDVLAGHDTFRIFNLHLASLHFTKHDYEFIESIIPGEEENIKNYASRRDTTPGSFLRVFYKLKSAFINRAMQVEKVEAQIKKSPYPVIVCGDLNDTPVSYAYSILNEHLSDAFLESGFGIGHTYLEFLPFLRIDYIFHSPSLISSGFEILPENLSDHKAIQCCLFRK